MARLASAGAVRRSLKALANPDKAKILAGFFKTAPGEYAEGDRFYGIAVPDSRRIARAARELPQRELRRLIASPIHEERLIALLILVERFERETTEAGRTEVYRFYLKHLEHVNNWDLVDTSAPAIVGGYLMDRGKAPLYRWARSPRLWERRVAILATQHFIRHRRFSDTLKIAKLLLTDSEDLIHKAVGWMLREVGNRDREVLERFLRSHYRKLPRTMLRYAIERLPAPRRRAYLEGRI
jgi:3-methyladenine DNA glycosylase AlkD